LTSTALAYRLLKYHRPGFESPEEAALFVEELQATLRYLGISNAQMELGQLRCDVNVSVELDGKEGTRVEIKNLNSIRAIRQALSYEYNRHVGAYKRGETYHKKPWLSTKRQIKLVPCVPTHPQ